MSDTNLHGVLNMPPELWDDGEINKIQRYDCYTEASRRIEDLTEALEDIKKHQELVGGTLSRRGTTWKIADMALSRG